MPPSAWPVDKACRDYKTVLVIGIVPAVPRVVVLSCCALADDDVDKADSLIGLSLRPHAGLFRAFGIGAVLLANAVIHALPRASD